MATTSVPVSLANDRGASGRALRAGPLGLIRVLSVRCEHHVVVLPDARIGRNCNINAMVFIENDVRVGDNVTVKSGVQLWDGVTLEDDVFVGPNATFTNDRYPRSKQYPERFERTLVKCGATIGGNATILCGLTIGRNAMIGAGSVVTHDVPDGELWVGNPARSCGQAHRLPGTAASDRAAT
jgi:UDP-2-acetamido-3-amino-2,3-dideoxy-glucuronate N-acetyltransferase